MTRQRPFAPNEIPTVLWNPKNCVLRIPKPLAIAYETVIDLHCLRQLAAQRNPSDSPVGGVSQDLTDKHFAQAFDGSAARALLAVLDPVNELGDVSAKLVEALSGNQLCIVDAPCGAGATSFSILAAIAELRAASILPRLPLDVRLVGADLSAPARAYAKELLHQLASHLEQQAVFLSSEFISWDVTDELSTTELISKAIECSSPGIKRQSVYCSLPISAAFLKEPASVVMLNLSWKNSFASCRGHFVSRYGLSQI